MNPKRPPVRVMGQGSVLGWVEPLPDKAPPQPEPDDPVQLPAVRCTRAERERWQAVARARGVSLSALLKSYLRSLESSE